MTLKTCSSCKKTKPLEEFIKSKNSPDGRHNQCNICHRITVKRHRKTDIGVESRYRENKLYRKKYPEKVKARAAVVRAIRKGTLISPKKLLCAYCKSPAAEYHHSSYEKEYRLLVAPVCYKCHSNLIPSS
jgi:hypothetical protein